MGSQAPLRNSGKVRDFCPVAYFPQMFVYSFWASLTHSEPVAPCFKILSKWTNITSIIPCASWRQLPHRGPVNVSCLNKWMSEWIYEWKTKLQENTGFSFSLIIDNGSKMLLKFCDFIYFFNSMVQDHLWFGKQNGSGVSEKGAIAVRWKRPQCLLGDAGWDSSEFHTDMQSRRICNIPMATADSKPGCLTAGPVPTRALPAPHLPGTRLRCGQHRCLPGTDPARLYAPGTLLSEAVTTLPRPRSEFLPQGTVLCGEGWA